MGGSSKSFNVDGTPGMVRSAIERSKAAVDKTAPPLIGPAVISANIGAAKSAADRARAAAGASAGNVGKPAPPAAAAVKPGPSVPWRTY